eukprot:6889698-Prymnesium_polylepis.1
MASASSAKYVNVPEADVVANVSLLTVSRNKTAVYVSTGTPSTEAYAGDRHLIASSATLVACTNDSPKPHKMPPRGTPTCAPLITTRVPPRRGPPLGARPLMRISSKS